ncbi:MAG: arsenical pump membrane protein-domain-containing protein [Monoraphidium minutum]|nr:MAG: arsenical pump membrane protein-domain-containing protein [Monoraphidium minutum]
MDAAGAAPGATADTSSPRAIGALVIFLLSVAGVIGLVLVPVKLPLPRRCRRTRGGAAGAAAGPARRAVRVPHWLAPPAGVLLMIASGCLDGRGLLAGVKGDASIQPYSILTLFLSLAYMAAALDQTGAFTWLALKMTGAAATGRRLFALHSLLAGAVTVLTSNDVVVMSLTPIVYVQATASGAPPLPYLAAEFAAANLWSMALCIGNPTNIIVAQAFDMSFLDYSKWMLAPTIAAGLAAAALLYLQHRAALPPRLSPPDIEPRVALCDPWGAALGAANLAVCLVLLAAAPSLGFPLWAITLACAAVICLYCGCTYVLLPRWRRRRLQGQGRHRSAAALLPHGGGSPLSSSKHCGGGGGRGCGGDNDCR